MKFADPPPQPPVHTWRTTLYSSLLLQVIPSVRVQPTTCLQESRILTIAKWVVWHDTHTHTQGQKIKKQHNKTNLPHQGSTPGQVTGGTNPTPTSLGFCFFQHRQDHRSRPSSILGSQPWEHRDWSRCRYKQTTKCAMQRMQVPERPARPTVSTCWCTEIVAVVITGCSWCGLQTCRTQLQMFARHKGESYLCAWQQWQLWIFWVFVIRKFVPICDYWQNFMSCMISSHDVLHLIIITVLSLWNFQYVDENGIWRDVTSKPFPDPMDCKVSPVQLLPESRTQWIAVTRKKIQVNSSSSWLDNVSPVTFQYLCPYRVWVDVLVWADLCDCDVHLSSALPDGVTECVWCKPKRYFLTDDSYLSHLRDHHGPPFLKRTLMVRHLKKVCERCHKKKCVQGNAYANVPNFNFCVHFSVKMLMSIVGPRQEENCKCWGISFHAQCPESRIPPFNCLSIFNANR